MDKENKYTLLKTGKTVLNWGLKWQKYKPWKDYIPTMVKRKIPPDKEVYKENKIEYFLTK